MTDAIVRRMDWSVEMNLLDRLEGDDRSSYRRLAAVLALHKTEGNGS
jgi:hypothetical protein